MADQAGDESPFLQWSKEVLDFSSQYGSETSISYTVPNLAGESTIYPNYGDFTQASVLRTYGPWWMKAPSAVPHLMRTPSSFISHDFIDLSFRKQVYPVKLEIREIYNPGAIVRILACNVNPLTTQPAEDRGAIKWTVLWCGDCVKQPAESRLFMPDLIECPFATNLIRLEINSTKCEYYSELDAVGLYGTETFPSWWKQPEELPNIQKEARTNDTETHDDTKDEMTKTELPQTPVDKLAKELTNLHVQEGLSAALDHYDNGYFEIMPDEVIQLVISYLDIPSLCSLCRTCRLLHKHCYDPLQYTELNLMPYWNKVTDDSLEGLHSRCTHLQRFNFSWCGGYNLVSTAGVKGILQASGEELVSLNLSCCRLVDNDIIRTISKTCPLLQDLDVQCCRKIDSSGFTQVVKLSKLRRLILYRTMIDVHSVIAIIRSCQDIEHLNLGSCVCINNYDDVAVELGRNCRNLKSLDLWRAKTFSDVGLHAVSASCLRLEELDIGWCSDVRSSTGCLVELAKSCKGLKKLFLTANRTVCDNDLEALANFSVGLEQLDILGTREVSQAVAQKVLENCKKMMFFDVSFCSGIEFITVDAWKTQFPNVAIKKSFQS